MAKYLVVSNGVPVAEVQFSVRDAERLYEQAVAAKKAAGGKAVVKLLADGVAIKTDGEYLVEG